MSAGREQGQSTVELALVLPVVMALILLVAQVGLVMRDRILVVHAARAAARAAAVGGDAAAAAVVASHLESSRMVVVVGRSDVGGQELVQAQVRYRSATSVPLVGSLVGDVVIEESVTMRREGE
jgi:Flp pilus assembly protein TadG